MEGRVDADVVIVGGRCAGAAAARLLAVSGVRVVVIDRAVFPSDTVSTHAVASAGAILLRQWGLLDEVVAAGTPVRRTVGARIGELEVTFPVPEGRPGAMAPRRLVLDNILIQAAAAAGATVMESTVFRGVVRDEDGRVVGVRATTPDAEVEIRASVVVGADGVGSPVREAVDAPLYETAPSWVSGVYAYYSGVAVDQNELAFGGRACTLAFPTNGDLVCVAAVQHDALFSDLVRGGDEAAQRVVAEASARIGEAVAAGTRETRFFAFRGRENFRAVPFGPGWALVGDAGYYRDPITGQGIADAFVSAQLLSDALVEGLGGAAPLDESLARYQRARDALSAEAYAVTCELSRYDWDEASLLANVLRYRGAVDSTASAVESGLGAAIGATAS